MGKIVKYALALLAAAAWGLPKPAAGQSPPPIVSTFKPTASEQGTDALALPRVVPLRPFSPTSPIAPVSAAAPKPALDLLTAPTVPAAWLAAPAKLTVIPSGLTTKTPAKPSAPVQDAVKPKIVLTPITAAPVRSVLIPMPVVSAAQPVLKPLTAAAPQTLTAAAPPARSWPPAHLVRKNVQDQEIRAVAHFEPAREPQRPATVPAPLSNFK
jgi:hypothetical protein